MKQRGRKSAAKMSVVEGNFGSRPNPPDDLTDTQAEIWKAVVSGEPADFFTTAANKIMLADYCRHRDSVEMVATVINEFKTEWLKSSEGSKRYQSLLKMRDSETRAATSLATKMRLTNQSRYTEKTAATAVSNAAKGNTPWDF